MGSFIVTCKAVYALLKLSSLILTEIFEAKKRARLESEEFEMNQKEFWKMVDVSTDKMLDEAEKDSKSARSVEDSIDSEYDEI